MQISAQTNAHWELWHVPRWKTHMLSGSSYISLDFALILKSHCFCRLKQMRPEVLSKSADPPGFREGMLSLFHPHVPMEVVSCILYPVNTLLKGDRDVQTGLLWTLLHQVLWGEVLLEALHRKRSCWASAEEELQVF